ncbi:hypothetical protein FNV43_RR15996 [Rhamnella rubrinervis]|uniref:Uncharacterized protein n=1 Tax=Rhamnella rubrinervis TaxID=2594499 RepID=A0A8K0EA37_9ROSA|nr:hypothetical protein FNV43_RR15996 [Rhamnella rubrinervis]
MEILAVHRPVGTKSMGFGIYRHVLESEMTWRNMRLEISECFGDKAEKTESLYFIFFFNIIMLDPEVSMFHEGFSGEPAKRWQQGLCETVFNEKEVLIWNFGRLTPLVINGVLDLSDKYSTDWDKAWKSFRKQGKKKSLFSQFSPNKYVSWNPRRSNYPLSEEVDPIKRTERSNLMLWTSPRFTLAGAIVLVTFLLVYTILAPIK